MLDFIVGVQAIRTVSRGIRKVLEQTVPVLSFILGQTLVEGSGGRGVVTCIQMVLVTNPSSLPPPGGGRG